MLISLSELVQEHRNLWDPKYGDYMKTKLRQHTFNCVANTLKLLYPNTEDVTGGKLSLYVYNTHAGRNVTKIPGLSEQKKK